MERIYVRWRNARPDSGYEWQPVTAAGLTQWALIDRTEIELMLRHGVVVCYNPKCAA